MSTTAERQTVLVNLNPDELDQKIVDPFGRVVDEMEMLLLRLKNATAEFSGKGWEARFENPPTFADIGAVAVFLERMRAYIGELTKKCRELEESIGRLDSMRANGWTRHEDD